mgnify:CR=1 FL=1
MVEEILSRLEKVKANGTRKWTACCPVHGDRSPSMSIKEESDGKVLCYCFACGAKGVDVVNALGLPVGALFGEESPQYQKGEWFKDKLLEQQASDELFQDLYQKHAPVKEYVSLADKRRERKARHRLEGIRQKLAENC